MFSLFDNVDIDNCSRVTTSDLSVWFQSVKGLTIIHLNIRSLNKHWDELNVILFNYVGVFDVLVLSEVSVSNESLLDTYKFNAYNSFHNIRINRSGGGVVIFVKNNINFKEIKSNFESFEGLFGLLTLSDNTLIYILSIYRPPNFSKIKFVNEIESFISCINERNVVIIGDVNLDLLQIHDNIIINYENLLAANGFTKCIQDVTRENFILSELVASCIDHIFVRSNSKEINSAIYKTRITDHYMVMVDIDFGKIINSYNLNHDINNLNRIHEATLKYNFKNYNWDNLLTFSNCDELYNAIVSSFICCYDRSSYKSSSIVSKPRIQKCWVNDDLRKAIKDRDLLFKNWKNCKNSCKNAMRDDYKRCRNNVNKQIMKAKAAFYKAVFKKSKGNIKQTWQSINGLLGKKKKDSVDEVISKYIGKKKSNEELVTIFANSFIDDVNSIIHPCDIRTSDLIPPNIQLQSMFMSPVTTSQISYIINHLDVNKQPGYDCIRVKDLVWLSDIISPILSKLINLSFETGIVPSKLKIAIIRPIFKKGDHLLYSNYRPIALLPIIDKIMERCVANTLTDYLKKFNIISKLQFGFQKGKSTSDLLVDFSNFVNSNLNNNMHVIALFIDFSKAFDTLSHSKLISSLENIGVRGPILKWFISYLKNRQILIKINDTCSNLYYCNTGVPQGSILGPILYLIYVNEMVNCLSYCQAFLYADDTVLLSVHKKLNTAEYNMQSDFNKILKWTHDNNLVINSNKTQLIHICSPLNVVKHQPIKLIFHSYNCLHDLRDQHNCNSCYEEICQVDNYVYLGITIDNDFTWRPHIDLLCKRLRACALQLYNLKFVIPYSVNRLIYTALAESLISYGLLAWGNASFVHLNKILSLQNNMIKSIAPLDVKLKYVNNITALYQHSKVLPVHNLFLYKFIVKFYFSKQYKTLYTKPLTTRSSNKIIYNTPTFNNKHGKRQLSYAIPSIFNKIPDNILNLNNINSVKREIKSWLLKLNVHIT